MLKKIQNAARKMKRDIICLLEDNKRFKIETQKMALDHEKKIILLGSPEYNNLGDHAIAFATSFFVKKEVANRNYYEFTEAEVLYRLKKIKKLINKRDIILLQGGGNMGDLYEDQELIRKKVILSFPDNKTIIMPQTIYYSKKDSKVPNYYKKENITIFAREKKSFDFLKSQNGIRVKYCPDIVMYMINNKEYYFDKKNKGKRILLCVRDDKEKSINRKTPDEIIKELKKYTDDIEIISTVTNNKVTINNREKEILKLLEKISNSDAVITDRLHGMIFSMIARTYCIVLPTFNYKVTESSKWLEKTNILDIANSDSSILNKYKNSQNILFNESFTLKKEYENLIMEMMK